MVVKGERELERRQRISPLIASIFSISKLLKSSLVGEEEESGVVCLWNMMKTYSSICGEMGQRTDQGSYEK